MNEIPYGKRNITEEDIQAVIETLKSDYLTQGHKIQEFEEVFAVYVGSQQLRLQFGEWHRILALYVS